MSQRYRYLHLDVFTNRLFGGNQLAVFTRADGLSTDVMQAIAGEMAFSETTFILPPERDDTDIRMRIFTPGKEMPMAGHPTIGSAFALALDGTIPAGRKRWVFGLNIGPTPVDIDWEGARPTFAWMTQPLPTFGTQVYDVGGVAEAIGLQPADIGAGHRRVQEVSCGVPFVFIPLATRAAVDRAAPNAAAINQLCARHHLAAEAVFIFSSEQAGDGATVYSRMFAPGLGVVEDPATGAASGPLGCYLLRHGVVPATQANAITSLQGARMGRPSWVHISIGASASGEISRVQVGGEAVLVGEGELAV
ncbi:MAG: PhzF family phenazine biosynthesis protein [Acidobacteria bacterium]|nr:PhzF family phenazine biosynthesis protein [Acidobacteriota bacterium]